MVEQKSCLDKLSQCKIGGPSKPYIDKNLQLELPNWECDQNVSSSSPNPIYSHFIGSSPSSHFHSPINETELYRAIEDAKLSYKSWKQMEQKLREAIKIAKK